MTVAIIGAVITAAAVVAAGVRYEGRHYTGRRWNVRWALSEPPSIARFKLFSVQASPWRPNGRPLVARWLLLVLVLLSRYLLRRGLLSFGVGKERRRSISLVCCAIACASGEKIRRSLLARMFHTGRDSSGTRTVAGYWPRRVMARIRLPLGFLSIAPTAANERAPCSGPAPQTYRTPDRSRQTRSIDSKCRLKEEERETPQRKSGGSRTALRGTCFLSSF